MLRRSQILILLLILAGIFIFGVWINTSKDSSETVGAISVHMGIAKSIITIPPLIGVYNGYFKERGLDIILDDSFSSGKTAFQALQTGNVDIATVATTPVVVSSFSSGGFSIFVTYTTAYDGIKLVARKDSLPLTAKTQIKKKFGSVEGTISQLFLNSYLTYAKVLPDEVESLYFPSTQLAAALKDGTVDAISIWEPFATQALNSMSGLTVTVPTEKVYRIAITFAAMNEYLVDNPEIISRIILALKDSVDFIKNHREEAISLSAELLDLEKEFLETIWDYYSFELSLDQLLIRTMESEAQWMINNNFIQSTSIPNFLDFIDTTAMDEILPDAVQIIKKD